MAGAPGLVANLRGAPDRGEVAAATMGQALDVDPAFLFGDAPDDVQRVRDVLDSAGYTTSGILAAIGADGPNLLARDEVEPIRRRTPSAPRWTRSCASSCARSR